MNIQFKRLSNIAKSEIIGLMNNQLVRRQLPLLIGEFSECDCDEFIYNKELLWKNHGFGPWAFLVNGKFAGWGGLQPENGEADLALVLHPNYWGLGKTLFKKIMNIAFEDMDLESITILLPPTRTRIKGVFSLGFKEDSELSVGNVRFFKYRLNRSTLK
ncbi:GNAT family N-acetyltransferase [Gaetbulibacter sp. M235]|uniref:GNAT family N-acetyltransferase n=1 Tax=Gaetbulibacter sp. M235 TaxID=3126510 RepID=UPI00374F3BD5